MFHQMNRIQSKTTPNQSIRDIKEEEKNQSKKDPFKHRKKTHTKYNSDNIKTKVRTFFIIF